MKIVINDGGRSAAGFKGKTGDCVCRAIAIASGLPYEEVYATLAKGQGTQRMSKKDKKRRRADWLLKPVIVWVIAQGHLPREERHECFNSTANRFVLWLWCS